MSLKSMLPQKGADEELVLEDAPPDPKWMRAPYKTGMEYSPDNEAPSRANLSSAASATTMPPMPAGIMAAQATPTSMAKELVEVPRRPGAWRSSEANQFGSQFSSAREEFCGQDDHKSTTELQWGIGFPWDDEIESTLQWKLGFSSFLPLQREMINAAFSRKDVFAVIPPGNGKSLCYLLPALQERGPLGSGTVLVVSRRLASVCEKVRTWCDRGIDARMLTANVEKDYERSALDALAAGRVRLLFVAPDYLVCRDSFTSSLHQAWLASRLMMIVIEEAHCCSQWGPEFRPDYLQLHSFREHCPSVPIIALTTSASQSVQQDIEHQLGIRGCLVLRSHSLRLESDIRSIMKTDERDDDAANSMHSRARCANPGVLHSPNFDGGYAFSQVMAHQRSSTPPTSGHHIMSMPPSPPGPTSFRQWVSLPWQEQEEPSPPMPPMPRFQKQQRHQQQQQQQQQQRSGSSSSSSAWRNEIAEHLAPISWSHPDLPKSSESMQAPCAEALQMRSAPSSRQQRLQDSQQFCQQLACSQPPPSTNFWRLGDEISTPALHPHASNVSALPRASSSQALSNQYSNRLLPEYSSEAYLEQQWQSAHYQPQQPRQLQRPPHMQLQQEPQWQQQVPQQLRHQQYEYEHHSHRFQDLPGPPADSERRATTREPRLPSSHLQALPQRPQQQQQPQRQQQQQLPVHQMRAHHYPEAEMVVSRHDRLQEVPLPRGIGNDGTAPIEPPHQHFQQVQDSRWHQQLHQQPVQEQQRRQLQQQQQQLYQYQQSQQRQGRQQQPSSQIAKAFSPSHSGGRFNVEVGHVPSSSDDSTALVDFAARPLMGNSEDDLGAFLQTLTHQAGLSPDQVFLGDPSPPHSKKKPPSKWSCCILLNVSNDDAASFQLVPRLIGKNGHNMKRIVDRCDIKIRIRGRGSGFEENRGQEADVPLQMMVRADEEEHFRIGLSMLLQQLNTMATRFAAYCHEQNLVPPRQFYQVRRA